MPFFLVRKAERQMWLPFKVRCMRKNPRSDHLAQLQDVYRSKAIVSPLRTVHDPELPSQTITR
jgi:hypothetical protein